MKILSPDVQRMCMFLNALVGVVVASTQEEKAVSGKDYIILSPDNVSVGVVSSSSIQVQWTMSKVMKPWSDLILRFDVTIRPKDDSYKIVIPVPPSQTSTKIEYLSPALSYTISVTTVGKNGNRRRSELVMFQMPAFKARTIYHRQVIGPPIPPPLPVRPDLSNATFEYHMTIRAEEVGIVALVLVFWVASVALFFNRWGKIRMLLPYQPVFKEPTSSVGSPVHNLGNQGTKQQQSFQDATISYSVPRCNHYGLYRMDTTVADPDQSGQHQPLGIVPVLVHETVNEVSNVKRSHRISYEIPQIRLLDSSRRSRSAETIPALVKNELEKHQPNQIFLSPYHKRIPRKQRSWAAYRRHTDPWLSVLVELAQSRINLSKQKTSSTANLEMDDKPKKLIKPFLGRLQAPSFLCSQSSASSNSSISTVINVSSRESHQTRPPRLGNVSTSLPLPRPRYNSLAALGRPEKPRSVNLESMKSEDSQQRVIPYKPLLEKHKARLSQSSHDSSVTSSSTGDDDYTKSVMANPQPCPTEGMSRVDIIEQVNCFECPAIQKIKHGERRKSLLQLRRAYVNCEPVASEEHDEDSPTTLPAITNTSVDI